jgi:hypothetical protein
MPANRRDTKRPLAVTLQHRHFAFIAAVLAKEKPPNWSYDYCAVMNQWQSACRAFAKQCRATNPRFDRTRFLTACGMELPQYQTEAGERLLYPRPD